MRKLHYFTITKNLLNQDLCIMVPFLKGRQPLQWKYKGEVAGKKTENGNARWNALLSSGKINYLKYLYGGEQPSNLRGKYQFVHLC